MKDILIIILVFVLIIYFGKQIVYRIPIPVEDIKLQRQLDEWQPFNQN